MTEFLFENNAVSSLATEIGSGDSSFTVDTGEGALFPSPSTGQGFYVLVKEGGKEEYMLVTSRSGDILSGITRSGVNSFSAGASVKLIMCSQVLENFLQKAYRTVTSDPDDDDLVADYSGEEVYQSTTKQWWKHTEGTDWVQISE